MIYSRNHSRIIPESVGPYARALTTRRQEGPQGVVGHLAFLTYERRANPTPHAATTVGEGMR